MEVRQEVAEDVGKRINGSMVLVKKTKAEMEEDGRASEGVDEVEKEKIE